MGTKEEKEDVVQSAFHLRKTEKVMLSTPAGPQKDQASQDYRLARKRFRNTVDSAMRKAGEP
jgi:hypothetical protein